MTTVTTGLGWPSREAGTDEPSGSPSDLGWPAAPLADVVSRETTDVSAPTEPDAGEPAADGSPDENPEAATGVTPPADDGGVVSRETSGASGIAAALAAGGRAQPEATDSALAEPEAAADEAVAPAPADADVAGEATDVAVPAPVEVAEEAAPAASDVTEAAEAASAAEPVPPAADEANPPEDSPGPAQDVAARESLVREAMARVADVSRETELLDVSRETNYDDTPIAAAAAAAVRATRQEPFPKPVHPRILTIANQKGGVGKTTTTVNMAAALALRGLDVLVIDLDPQGNASTALGVDHSAGTPNVYDVLVTGRPLAEVVQQTPIEHLTCAPATIDLAGAEIELVPVVAREGRLKRALAAYDRPYDYVFIDCPPSLGLLTVNALVAAKEIVIPIQCEFYALEGLGQLLHNVELIRSHLNERLEVSTILLTMYDGRTKLADQVATEVRSHFGERVLGAMIPRSVRISEAPGYGQTVLTYDPASRGAQAYLDAARELAERGARTEGS